MYSRYMEAIMRINDDVRDNFHLDNFYQVLEVSNDAYPGEIKKAYLKKSLELHPDKVAEPGKKEESNRKFQILSALYKILSDNKSRDCYDQEFVFNDKSKHEPAVDLEIRLTDCIRENGYYSYDCRCSGIFKLEESYLARRADKGSTNVYIVDCETCSCVLKIIP